MSVALQATPFARRWPYDGPVTAFIPNDEAMARLGPERVDRLLAATPARDLMDAVLAHVAPGASSVPAQDKATLRMADGRSVPWGTGSAGACVDNAAVTQELSVPPHRVFIVDRWLPPVRQPGTVAARSQE
jgi:hypothetical protein